MKHVIRVLILCLTPAIVAGGAEAQLISIKTVPIANGEQFRIFPSDRPGMGGVELAVVDSLGDVFSNPALGYRLDAGVGFGAPVVYGIEQDGGSGQTLPLGAFLRGDQWFGGLSVALQQLSAADPGFTVFPGAAVDPSFCICPGRWPAQQQRNIASRNLYATALVGMELDGGLALGLEASIADLRWMAGIEHLYAGSARIEPSGTVSSVRLGFVQSLGNGGEFEGVLLRSETDMSHDVLYREWFVGVPDTTLPPDQWVWPEPVLEERTEVNLDRTTTWGGELTYRVPIENRPWTVGASAAVNRKDHPKIPNYEIQNIPRDPGESWAFRVGLGVGWSQDGTTFGADVLYEPISSNTWQEADTAFTGTSGRSFLSGDRTIENDFTFSNATLRLGLDHDWRRGDVQFGVEARSIAYDLVQDNHAEGFPVLWTSPGSSGLRRGAPAWTPAA